MADVTIYRTTYCQYCNMAKRLLEGIGVDYEEVDVTHDDDMRQTLVDQTGMRTVPQIFIDGESIGGYTDLKDLQQSGKLADMLG